MKIRLHEIEIGTGNVESTTNFFNSVLGLTPNLSQDNLTVFDAGVKGLDFNISNLLPAGITVISFLTDDLQAVQEKLSNAGISFEGPAPSHLEMTAISFKTTDGLQVKVNTPGQHSPDWLKV